MIEQLISQATSQLGIGEDVAKSAAGGVLGLIKDQAGDDTFGKLAGAIPGASDLIGGAEQSSGGGLMGAVSALSSGNVMGAVTGLMGGGGGLAGAVAALSDSGLNADQASGFLGLALNFLKQNAGDSIMGEIVEKVPFLGELLD